MDNGLRYNSITKYYKKTFGCTVYKLALDIGATCPNRDGKLDYNGCIFCSGAGSGDYSTQAHNLDIAKSKLKNKQIGKYIAYFQSFSNTYMLVSRLDKYVKMVLQDKEVCGISISTRPDCISQDMLNYLIDLNKHTHLVIELGLQSAFDKTLKLIERGHTFKDFLDTFNMLKEQNIKVCVHIMDGLPQEGIAEMLETARVVSELKPHSVKIHCTYVPKDTKLAQMYYNGEYSPLTMQEYIEILAKQLEILGDEIYIERLTGDGDRTSLIVPEWSLHKRYFLNQLNKYLANKKGSID